MIVRIFLLTFFLKHPVNLLHLTKLLKVLLHLAIGESRVEVADTQSSLAQALPHPFPPTPLRRFPAPQSSASSLVVDRSVGDKISAA